VVDWWRGGLTIKLLNPGPLESKNPIGTPKTERIGGNGGKEPLKRVRGFGGGDIFLPRSDTVNPQKGSQNQGITDQPGPKLPLGLLESKGSQGMNSQRGGGEAEAAKNAVRLTSRSGDAREKVLQGGKETPRGGISLVQKEDFFGEK